MRAEWADAFRGPRPLVSEASAFLLIAAVAVATRIVAWWDPVAHIDDQFYLLVGEEMLKGQWPYLDIWDRKPPGLFLLYAGIALIGGGSILAVNLVATAFAAATALVIRRIGLRFASPEAATLGALAYLVVIPLLGGQTGQSPVFYNLLMALAALKMFNAERLGNPAAVRSQALMAMLLCGVAMTIKQTTFVEGAFFGVAFLWLLLRRGSSPVTLLVTATAMVALALLPTGLSILVFALAGPQALDAYIHAAFVSVFEKSGWGAFARLAGVSYFLLHTAVLLGMAIAGALDRARSRGMTTDDRLLIGWATAALLGYAAVPNFFEHYALPLVVPLAISASTFFDRPSGWLFFVALALFSVIQPPIRAWSDHQRSIREYARLSDVVNRARHGGCIHVADGPTHLYSSTGACRLTRYLFSHHLLLRIEAGAVGVDTASELRRVLASRPAVITTQDIARPDHHPVADRILYDALAAEYRQVYRIPPVASDTLRTLRVWQRRDLLPPTP